MELIAEAVGHRYGELQALDGVSLRAAEGETLVLIGPSGCGKSTLLQILGGLLQPSEGRALAAGAAPADCLNPLTFVFQDFALLPWRTVAGNVRLALEHHRLAAAETEGRVREALATTGLSEFAEAYPKQLSGGMRQRVGLARALVVNPAVMLMDEPLSALDAQTRELLMEDLVALWSRRRTTTVYVTHNLAEALKLGDRVAVLSRRPGRLKHVVEVRVPQAERASAAAELAKLERELWALIRDEALVAEREVADV